MEQLWYSTEITEQEYEREYADFDIVTEYAEIAAWND